MIRILFIGAICITLVACVRTSTTMLDSRTAIISGKGSAFHDQAGVLQKVLVESATTTKQRGYDYFVVVGAANTTTQGTVVLPGQTYSSGTATGTATTFGSNTTAHTSYSGQSWSTPSSVIPVVKPGADVMIRMYGADEIDASSPGVWEADSILSMQDQNGGV